MAIQFESSIDVDGRGIIGSGNTIGTINASIIGANNNATTLSTVDSNTNTIIGDSNSGRYGNTVITDRTLRLGRADNTSQFSSNTTGTLNFNDSVQANQSFSNSGGIIGYFPPPTTSNNYYFFNAYSENVLDSVFQGGASPTASRMNFSTDPSLSCILQKFDANTTNSGAMYVNASNNSATASSRGIVTFDVRHQNQNADVPNGHSLFEVTAGYGNTKFLIKQVSGSTNVGIGTTNPLTKLQVGNGTADDAVRSYFNDGSYTEMRGYGLQLSRSISYIRPTADNTKTLYLGSNVAQWQGLSIDATTTTFNTNGSENMRITSSGNVGIGTTSPQGLLHLSSDSTPTLIIGTKTANQANSGAISFREIESTSEVELRYNGADNAFKIWTSLAGDALSVLRSNGNVGIGTTDPKYKLQIGINGGLSSSIKFGTYDVPNNTRQYIGYSRADSGVFETTGNGDSEGTVLAGVSGIRISNRVGSLVSTKSDNSVQILTHIYNGGSRIAAHFDANGNVGIGTTSPNKQLTVVGEATVSNNVYIGSGNGLYPGTYPAQYGLVVGRNNLLGGIASGIIGDNNTIHTVAEPWNAFGGNFIAGRNNEILGGYSHANAVFGQENSVAQSTLSEANNLVGGSFNTLHANGAFMYGYSGFATGDQSLTGGWDSNNFGSFGSVAIGAGATASLGNNQYAFGTGVTTPTTISAAYGADQFVVGKYNEYTNASSIPHRFAVGNGNSDASRDTPFCVIGGGTYTNGQVSINDADGFAYTSIPYSIFHVNGRATSSYSSTFTLTSDERLKKDILDYNKGLAEILQVKPKSYSFNGKANTIDGVKSIGVLAQEIKEVFPETVGTVNKKLNPEDEQETELYTVDISPVTYALINAVKELNAKVEALEARIQTLEGN